MNKSNFGMNKTRQRDFSNPVEAREVLEHLGGEVLIKEQFPKIYEAYLKTVRKHKKRKRLKANAISDKGPDKNTDGLENGAFAGAINGITAVQGNEDWTAAYVSGYTKNETDGTLIHRFGQKLEDKNYFETVQPFDRNDMNQFPNQKIKNYIDCTAVLKNDNTMVSLKAESNEFILAGSSSPVVEIYIDAPRSNSGNNPIKMMYGRSPDFGEVSDYHYPDNHRITGTDVVKTMFPIKGKITFSDDVTPIGYNAISSRQKPMLQFKGKGVCTYNYSQNEIASCFKISDTNPQVVEFQLNEDWNANLDINAYEGQANQGNIALRFSFFITTKMAGTEMVQDQAICIYSTDLLETGKQYYESSNDANAYLPNIEILWGCFGKDTMIQMADRSSKVISQLMMGDRILGEDGKILTVNGMVSGYEEVIYCIKTSGMKEIQLSGAHPVATTDGTVRAQALKPKMKILCADGSEDEIEFSYKKNYGDTVYNIVTEGGSEWVVANGFFAGNFELQNEPIRNEMDQEVMSGDVHVINQEFNRLMKHLLK